MSTPTLEQIHDALALLRAHRGLTLSTVAGRLGLRDKSAAHSIERGNPRLESLRRYLEALEASWRELADAIDQASGTAAASSSSGPTANAGPLLEHLAERYLDARFERLRNDPDFRAWILEQLGATPSRPTR